jgi:hypothetical protein
VLYERPDDFPDRVEMLSQVQREADPAPHSEPELSAEAEIASEPMSPSEPNRAEDRGSRGLGNVIEALFRRRA